MTGRPTTFGLSAVFDAMGVKGGERPGLAPGPIQPVAIVSDFSQTQAPEAVEARAQVAFEYEVMASEDVNSLFFFALGRGGCIVEALDLAFVAAGANGSAYPTRSLNVQLGSWFVQRTDFSPSEVYFRREPGETQQEAIDAGGPEVARDPAAKMEIGGVESKSVVHLPQAGVTAFQHRVAPDFTFHDPFDWVSDPADPGSTVPQLVLPPVASMRPGVRWFVPKGTGIFIAQTSVGTNLVACVSILWREVPESLGLP